VPVIFHDSFLSIHTVKNKLYGGLLHNYNYEELKAVELRKGGNIPTLEECLHTIVYHTPLHTIWLDIKKECDLTKILKLQKEYLAKAAGIDRHIKIYIGVPDKKIMECFTSVADYKNIPALCELETEDAKNINAEVWAPQYTGGTQKDKVDEMHSAGKKVFVWSLDNEFLIDTYITEGGFDGLVSNTPSVVAHWWYTKDLVADKKRLAVNSKT
ncbi:MAG: glycerophosphodiester phosphodiesterase family protein, partial [Bacteroidota bacterium]